MFIINKKNKIKQSQEHRSKDFYWLKDNRCTPGCYSYRTKNVEPNPVDTTCTFTLVFCGKIKSI